MTKETVIEAKKQYREPRVVQLSDAVAITLSFGQSLIRDRTWRFPI